MPVTEGNWLQILSYMKLPTGGDQKCEAMLFNRIISVPVARKREKSTGRLMRAAISPLVRR